jgi:outer membrane assembly lipoprotein YfiO
MATGHYRPAAEELERLVLNFPDQGFSDQAQFLLGEAHMGLGEYLVAESAFRMLIDSYPASQFRDDAELAIALCYARQSVNHRLDQSSTVAAERALEQFVEDHPNGLLVPRAQQELRHVRERLSLKLLDSARFYLKRGRTEAARVYADQIMERYPSSHAALEARFLRGRCAEKDGNAQEAAIEYAALLEDLPAADPLRNEALERLSEIRSKLDGA